MADFLLIYPNVNVVALRVRESEQSREKMIPRVVGEKPKEVSMPSRTQVTLLTTFAKGSGFSRLSWIDSPSKRENAC